MTENENKILLQDLLHLSDEECARAKVKFNIPDGSENPIELFKNDREKLNTQWLFWNEKLPYFKVGQIAICLARIEGDKWLLTTIKEVTKDLNISGGIRFEGEEITRLSKFYGRVVIHYHNTYKNMGRLYNKVANKLEVVQVLPGIFDDDDFPGYDNIRLSFVDLKRILDTGKNDWKAALENQKAVYLLTDTATGKLYVGSATSNEGMLLKRWGDYIKNGHGGNKELKQLIAEQGIDYIKQNFQYSIIENYNARVDDKLVLEREAYWKNVLCTREFGYNAN